MKKQPFKLLLSAFVNFSRALSKLVNEPYFSKLGFMFEDARRADSYFEKIYLAFVASIIIVAAAPLLLVAMAISILMASDKSTRVLRAPGHQIVRVLEFLFPRKIFENIFLQSVIDMREEHSEALNDGASWKARLRHFQLYLTLILTFVVWCFATIGKRVQQVWKLF